MADEKKADPQKPITRREFTKGSMAVIGAYSSFSQELPEPLSGEAKALKLEISSEVQSLMDDRHILEEDVRRIIEHAEKTGMKLYRPGSDIFLSKLRIYNAMFYAEYSPVKDAFRIHTAYSHRFKLGEED